MFPALRNSSLVPTLAGGPVNRLSSLFDQFFNDPLFTTSTTAQPWTVVPLAIWEDEQNVYAEMDLPGITEKDVDVSVHNGDLIIRGERKCERQAGGYDTRSYGRFEQRVTLPSVVDADRVDARLANGVLSLTFRKSEEARPRKIALKSE